MCVTPCGRMKPLTEKQIDEIIVDGSFHNAAGGIYSNKVYDFVIAIERAHNIGVK